MRPRGDLKLMPEVPLKFRCHACGQLIGASERKVGKTVRCPRCATGLVVPAESSVEAPLQTPAPAPAASEPAPRNFFDGLELDPNDLRTLFPVETIDEAPEGTPPPDEPLAETQEDHDIAVGPAFRPWPDEPPATQAEGDLDESGTHAVFVFEPDDQEPDRPPAPPDSEPETLPPAIDTTPPPPLVAPMAEELPARGELPLAERRPRPSRDVVLPRLAVLAWSLFVLLALFLAFLAGLFAGHFLWLRPA